MDSLFLEGGGESKRWSRKRERQQTGEQEAVGNEGRALSVSESQTSKVTERIKAELKEKRVCVSGLETGIQPLLHLLSFLSKQLIVGVFPQQHGLLLRSFN